MAGRWFRVREFTFHDPLGDYSVEELIDEMPDRSEDDRFHTYHQQRFAERMTRNRSFCEQLIREHCGAEHDEIVQWWLDEEGQTWIKRHSDDDPISEGAEVQSVKDMLLTNISGCEPKVSPLWFAAKFLSHLDRIDYFEECGETISRDREIYLLGQTWAQAALLVNHGIRGVKGGQSTGGRARKRRQWAEIAAEYLARNGARAPSQARAMVPEGQPIELDEDHAIYMDAETLCCIDRVAERQIGTMGWESFVKRYLRKKFAGPDA